MTDYDSRKVADRLMGLRTDLRRIELEIGSAVPAGMALAAAEAVAGTGAPQLGHEVAGTLRSNRIKIESLIQDQVRLIDYILDGIKVAEDIINKAQGTSGSVVFRGALR